ncbi:MAG: YihY/virulence factor BrkB family protein [Chloroflexi bacterium]|nr:YihY/virulence factor BrkB family protein [Chloroflexota bacterium]
MPSAHEDDDSVRRGHSAVRYTQGLRVRFRRPDGLLERMLWFLRQASALERLINRWRPLLVLEASLLAIMRPNIQQLGAGVAYYGIMAMMPLLVVGLQIIAVWLGQEEARIWFNELSARVFPAELDIAALLGDPSAQTVGVISGLAFVGLAWGLFKLFGAVSAILNLTWGIEPSNTRFADNLKEIMAIGAAATVFLVSSVLTWVVVDDFTSQVLRALRLLMWADALASASVTGLVNLLAWLLLVLSLVIIYRYVPRRLVRWRWAALGSLAVGVALQLMNFGFVMFMTHVAPSQFVQGILASALVILFWLFLAARLLAWGAALSAYAQSVYDLDGPQPGSVFR